MLLSRNTGKFLHKKNIGLLAALTTFAILCACSNDQVAGSIIETNTGNKILIETNTGAKHAARAFVVPSILELSENDTLFVESDKRDTVLDSVYVYGRRKIADSASIANDMLEIDSLVAGHYDSLEIRLVSDSTKTIAIDWNIEEGKLYLYDSEGFHAISHVPGTDTTETDFKDTSAVDTTTFDTTATDTVQKSLTFDTVSIVLPDGFADLASADEIFKAMPFAVRLSATYTNPCAYDANGAKIPLDRTSGANSASESKLYWGEMEQVYFTDANTIELLVLDSCQETDSLGLTLGRRVVHFDDQTPSETAIANLPSTDAAFGQARWTDSTDFWFLVEDFDPFVDGSQMSASIWINMDSSAQMESYMRILSAAKDSVGFIVQQRADRTAVNLRLNARKNGVGDYNKVVGTANILDGTWHNYAFTIRGDSVYVYSDGSLIQATDFDSGEGFADAYNPAIGNSPNIEGGIDEVFFLDGSQNENWMRLFYALQKQAME